MQSGENQASGSNVNRVVRSDGRQLLEADVDSSWLR